MIRIKDSASVALGIGALICTSLAWSQGLQTPVMPAAGAASSTAPGALPSKAPEEVGGWPRANCSQLNSIGSPAPAWVQGTKNIKSEALLMLINYQLSWGMCQQEAQMKIQEEQNRLLKDVKEALGRQERALVGLKDTKSSQAVAAVPPPVAAVPPTSSAAETKWMQQLVELLQKNQASGIAANPANPMIPPAVVQNTQLTDLERNLLKLIESLSQKQKDEGSVSLPAIKGNAPLIGTDEPAK